MSEGNGQATGTIKWYNDSKGYGFIKPTNGGPDVFVHANELRNCGLLGGVKEGDRVSYVTDKRPKGPYATKLVLVNP